MIIIIGLGNPGLEYNQTPHNIGFNVVNLLQKEENFPDFRFSKKFQAKITEKNKIILVKPQTFMNASGKTASSLVSFYKIKSLENLWVVHDDFDLSLGKIRISQNRNSAGHKGVQSIIDYLQSKNFVRFRIGVSTDVQSDNLKYQVLKKFKKEDREKVEEIIKQTKDKIDIATKKGLK